MFALAGAFCALALPGDAPAASYAEVRAQIRSLERSGTWDLDRQEPILGQIERWAQQFYELADRGRDRSAKGIFDQLYPVLKQIHDHNDRKTEAMVNETVRRDGDLEATQETEVFRNAETARIRSLYHLNWVSYLGATLLPEGSAQRRRLLEFAAENFGEFVVGPDEAIAREALLGRAEARRGLGRVDEALSDLRRLVRLGPKVPQYAKARSSILDALLEAKRVDEAIREADAAMADATAGRLPPELGSEARLAKAQALFLRLKSSDGGGAAARRQWLQEALSLLRQVERQGGSWRRKVRAIASWGLEGLPEADMAAGSGFAGLAVAQAKLAKGEYAGALESVEKLLESGSLPKSNRPEAHFYAGIAAFQLERHALAAKHLRTHLAAAPRSSNAGEAAYMLFKSLEPLATAEAAPPNAKAAYRRALEGFVTDHPRHSAHSEAQFRLAELLRDEGDLAAATEQFRKVSNSPTLEIYARFNASQTVFQRLQAGEEDPKVLAEERNEALKNLARLANDLRAPDQNDPALRSLAAKAALLGGMMGTMGDDPDYAKALRFVEDFANRFPEDPELARQAFSIEILALQKAEDPERARLAIEAYLGSLAADSEIQRRALLKRLGREFFAQAEAERAAGRMELAEAASGVSIEIYEHLLSRVPVGDDTVHARRGLHAILGRLHESMNHDADAVRHYAEVLDIEPRSPEAWEGLARLSAKTGDHQKSAGFWEGHAKLAEPGDDVWFESRHAAATEWMRARRPDQACRIAEATIDESPFPLTGSEKTRWNLLIEKTC